MIIDRINIYYFFKITVIYQLTDTYRVSNYKIIISESDKLVVVLFNHPAINYSATNHPAINYPATNHPAINHPAFNHPVISLIFNRKMQLQFSFQPVFIFDDNHANQYQQSDIVNDYSYSVKQIPNAPDVFSGTGSAKKYRQTEQPAVKLFDTVTKNISGARIALKN